MIRNAPECNQPIATNVILKNHPEFLEKIGIKNQSECVVKW